MLSIRLGFLNCTWKLAERVREWNAPGLRGLRACLLGHVTRPKTRRTHNECSIGPFAQNRKKFRRCEFNRCKVECSAVGRSGTAPRTHAGSATCRAPTEEITRAKRTWSRGCQAQGIVAWHHVGTGRNACATEKLDYFWFLGASFLMTAPFFITKFILRMDSMSSRGLEGMAMMSA